MRYLTFNFFEMSWKFSQVSEKFLTFTKIFYIYSDLKYDRDLKPSYVLN